MGDPIAMPLLGW